MSIWDRCAESVYRIATGGRRQRFLATPLLGSFYLGLAALLVFASFWVDERLTLLHFDPTWWSLGLSVLLLVPACLIMVWPVMQFFRARGTPVPLNPPKKLITTGLYAYIRNPMILGLLLLLLGLGILFGSLSLILIFTPLFIVPNILYLRAVEEKEMEKKFGQEYLEYKKKVPMSIPRLRKMK